tara:strand:+ start:272 stop:1552 length:1281 start_codon:yes stop_codon:yes gene_type:complete
MNIALIGSGGREHSLCQKIYESKNAKKIICLPGNAGTSKIAQNIEVDTSNFKKILNIIKLHRIDLVIIGPEEFLVKGLVDYLLKNKIKVFGPNKYASKLEGSKAFMKKLCKKYKIPTAAYKICSNISQVNDFLRRNKLPTVVKADGLAAGKGVTICNSENQVRNISNEIFKGKFKSSKKLILEEYLNGEEASYFIIVDKFSFRYFGSAQDHKRVGENDTGPNTGGMGAYSPAPIISKKIEKKIIDRIIKPTLLALRREKNPYRGFLYVGLMIKGSEPYLIEFNVRMGDPECQVILPRLKTDLLKLLHYASINKLKNVDIKWKKDKCMTIVLCSKGYPAKYKKNIKINNLDKINVKSNEFIFHAGTKLTSGKLVSNGGRVLNITASGKSFLNIRKNIINLINKVNWKHGFFRKDIGRKVIKNAGHKR